MFNWKTWHTLYDHDPSMRLRLKSVRTLIANSISARPAGRIRILSICAGDGRDLIPVVAASDRRTDIRGVCIEVSEDLVRSGESAIEDDLLESQLKFVCRDATRRESYQDVVPSDIVIACGVFGNLLPDDEALFIDCLAALCVRGGHLIWTRNLLVSDGAAAVPRLRQRLKTKGFAESRKICTPEYVVACHEQERNPAPLPTSETMFKFTPFCDFPKPQSRLRALLTNILLVRPPKGT